MKCSLFARICIGLVVGLCWAHVAAAESTTDERSNAELPDKYVCSSALLSGCPGNYCAKPMPCIKAYCPGCGDDDYCCKPMPGVQSFCGPWRCDRYCPRPFPCLCRPLAADFYTCATGRPGCCCSKQACTTAADTCPIPPVVDSPNPNTEHTPNLPPPSDPR